MVKSTLFAVIGFVAISSTALAEDLSSATAPLPPGTFTTAAHSDARSYDSMPRQRVIPLRTNFQRPARWWGVPPGPIDERGTAESWLRIHKPSLRI